MNYFWENSAVLFSLILEIFQNVFTEFSEFIDKNITVKRLEPATSCVGDHCHFRDKFRVDNNDI